MSNDRLAFFIGLLGSLHCIGMCGPLAFSVPVTQPGWLSMVWNKLLYQMGRIASYTILGAFVGLLGKQIWQAGFQQGVSIITGLLILVAALSKIFKLSLLHGNPMFLVMPINNLFSYAFHHKANHLIIGMINGILPCGFVFLALAGAINMENIQQSMSYMFWFGLGTTPLMFAATLIVGFSGMPFRKRLNRFVPYMLLLLGIWFFMRGLELGIPYLSPQRPGSASTECR